MVRDEILPARLIRSVPACDSRCREAIVFARLLTRWRDRCSDYINPIDLCNRLNTYIVPEAAVHGFLTFLFLINGYWLPLAINLPLIIWNAKKYVPRLAAAIPDAARGTVLTGF